LRVLFGTYEHGLETNMQFPVSSSMYELSHLRQIPLESRAVHGEEDVNITAVSVAIIIKV